MHEERKQTLALVASDLPPELSGDKLTEAAQEFIKKLQSLQVSIQKNHVSAMEMREQIKQGNIFFYQTPVLDMMKGVLTIFNKTELGVFQDRRDVSLEQQRSDKELKVAKQVICRRETKNGGGQ